jgi:peptidoglycan/LPS O-acetylase OafA/YrhL
MSSVAVKHPDGKLARLDGVDALRALAIFFVLTNHVNMRLLIAKVPYTNGLPEQLVSSLVWNGQPGVQIFFAVSGFLITSMSVRRWGSLSSVSLRGFYLMRFARIAPLLIALLATLSLLHLLHLHDFVVSSKTGGLGRALLAALTFHVNVLEARRGYLPGNWDILWSLSVEEMFYLFFPVMSRLFGRGKLFVAILLVFFSLGPFARVVFPHGNEVWREYSYLGGMDAIAMGCLTALLVSRIHFSRVMLWSLGSTGIALLSFVLCFSNQLERLRLTLFGLDMTLLAIGTCLVIAVVAQTNWRTPRALSPILNLGRRSYEIYLTHMFVVFAMFHLFVWAGKPLRGVAALFLSVIVISALCGELVARFFSEPMNQWIRVRWRASRGESTP